MAAATRWSSKDRNVRSMISCVARVSSKTPMIAASEVSLTRIVQRSTKGGSPTSDEAYFGCATVRRYGFTVLKPCGYFFLASSSDTDVGMMTSWPGFQFTGVATTCLAVNWHESRRSEEHTSELQSLAYLVCRLLLEKKKKITPKQHPHTLMRPPQLHGA